MTALSPDDELPSAELAPRRMIDGGAGEHERRLIASAQLDRTPSGAKARVAAALGGVLEPQAGPGAAPTGPEPAVRGDALEPAGMRWGLGGVGAGIVGAIALAFWLPATHGQSSNAGRARGGPLLAPSTALPTLSPPAAPRIVSTAPPAAAVVAAPNPGGASPAGLPQQADLALQADLAQPRVHPRPERPRHERLGREGVAAHREPVDSGLLAEVRALEAVSAAIGAGQADRAALELDAYRRRFAHGELAIEADVLAIQIATARGDDDGASARAERLLARPEAEHYRGRVRSLLASKRPASGAANRENAGPSRSNDAAAHMRARR
jgi:hypothetical protein